MRKRRFAGEEHLQRQKYLILDFCIITKYW